MKFNLMNVHCGYYGKTVVDGFSASVSAGSILCLLGPNGVGKTTLLKCILRLIPMTGGNITVDDTEIRSFSTTEYAKIIAYVPQAHTPPFSFRVFDVIAMGRTARTGLTGRLSRHDEQVVERCMQQLEITHLADCVYTEISGGERQMVLIARALAQEPRFLIMDEPTSNLDFGNQSRALRSVRSLSDQGLGIIMTTHHPDQVFELEANAALMLPDHSYLTGQAKEVITEQNLKEAYGVKIAVLDATYQEKHMRICRSFIDGE